MARPFFCGKDSSPAGGVPERSAGMEAKAGRANRQKAAQVFMEKIKKLQYTVFKKGRFL